MRIFCVRIGDKYGHEYEEYLERKLPEYDFTWIREPFMDGVALQWNKMSVMGMDIDEPVVVMDIDMILVGDYKKVFDYPIDRGQFLAIPGWWRNTDTYKINGGFFKYYPSDTKDLYHAFIGDISHWQNRWIKNGTTVGPVNGEQYFVEEGIERLGLELITLPDSWFTRWATSEIVEQQWESYNSWQHEMTKLYKEKTGNEYIYMGGEFHPDIKFVHFTHSLNKPHNWVDYKDFTAQ